MKRNTKRKQHVRAIVYYLSIVISLGLIWGGGMSLLRGGVIEGVVSILLGILLQLGLKRYGTGNQARGPKSDKHALSADNNLRDADVDEAAPVMESADDVSEQVRQKAFQRRAARGTDGATLMVDSRTNLDLTHKYERGRTDES